MAELHGRPVRYFIDDTEVTAEEAIAAGASGAAKVSVGASGIVPEDLRQPGETEDDWIAPWIRMRSIV